MNTNQMTEEEKRAYEWALAQQFQSVAARQARTLAKFIERTNGEIKPVVKDKYAGRCSECGDPNHKAAECDMEG